MDFKVDACLGCKKLIKYTKFNLCDECRIKYFNLIRDFLAENKSSNNVDISKSLGINIRIVNFFIQEESLVDMTYRINQENMAKVRTLTNISDKLKNNTNGSMKFLDNKNKR